MVKYWFNRLRGLPSVRYYPLRSVLLYREGSHEIEIGGENLADGQFQIDPSTIVCWSDTQTELLSENEKLRIAAGAAQAAAAQWGMSVIVR